MLAISFPAFRLTRSRTHSPQDSKPCRPYWTGSPFCPSYVGGTAIPVTMFYMTNTATLRNEVETQILTPEASDFLTKLARKFEARREELLARRRARQQQIDAGQLPDFLPETAAHPPRRMDGCADSARPARPPRGDHRARGPQDDHQRAELRRQRLHGGFRGLQFAHLAEQHRRPDQSARRRRRDHQLRQPGGQAATN